MQVQEWLIERERLLGRIKELEAENAELRKRLGEDVEVPIYLLKLYEKILADWFMLGGVDVQYDQWGW